MGVVIQTSTPLIPKTMNVMDISVVYETNCSVLIAGKSHRQHNGNLSRRGEYKAA